MEVMLAIRKIKITLKKDGREILRETFLDMASDLCLIGPSGCRMRIHIPTDWHEDQKDRGDRHSASRKEGG